MTESTIEKRLGTPQYSRTEASLRVAFTGGLMINVGQTHGIGLTAAALSGDTPHRFEGRYRWWNGKDGFDFSGGIAAGLNPAPWRRNPGDRWIRGVTTSVGFSHTYFGADLRLDLTRRSDGRMAKATFISVRTGSRAGPIVAAALLLLGWPLFVTEAT